MIANAVRINLLSAKTIVCNDHDQKACRVQSDCFASSLLHVGIKMGGSPGQMVYLYILDRNRAHSFAINFIIQKLLYIPSTNV